MELSTVEEIQSEHAIPSTLQGQEQTETIQKFYDPYRSTTCWVYAAAEGD